MKRLRTLLLLAATMASLGSASLAEAQGWLTGRDVSALGLSSGVGVGDGTTDLTGQVVLTANGMADLAIHVGRGWLDENEFGTDFTFTGFGPSITLYPLNNTEKLPVVVALSAGATRAWYSDDMLDDLNVKLTATAWVLAISISAVVDAEDVRLIPSVGISHAEAELTAKGFGHSESVDEGFTSLSGGATLAFGPREGATLYVSPGVSISEESTDFRVNVGVSFADPVDHTRRSRRSQPPSSFTRPPAPVAATTPEPSSGPPEAALPIGVLVALTQGVPPLTAVSVTQLDSSQLAVLGQTFKVPPTSIKTFRWGNSMAPMAHPHYQTTWLTLEYGEGAYAARETIRIDRHGTIVERTKE